MLRKDNKFLVIIIITPYVYFPHVLVSSFAYLLRLPEKKCMESKFLETNNLKSSYFAEKISVCYLQKIDDVQETRMRSNTEWKKKQQRNRNIYFFLERHGCMLQNPLSSSPAKTVFNDVIPTNNKLFVM